MASLTAGGLGLPRCAAPLASFMHSREPQVTLGRPFRVVPHSLPQ